MLTKLKEFFKKDYFAMDLLGIEIEKAENGVCECTLKKRKELLNANAVMQGGALYTLGDFAFAVGAASSGNMAVTSSLTINYIKPGKGDVFRAVATIRRLTVVPYLPIAIELFRYPPYAERFE